MDWLNYHHLLYFWTVVREGTIAAAAQRLQLAQPTISTQLRALETALGVSLFTRDRRKLELTETGLVVYRYADDIFVLGNELLDTVKGRPTGHPIRFRVGVADVVPKLVAHRLLTPALGLDEPVRLICNEGKPEQLLARLVVHEVDVVLSDAPIGPSTHIKGFNHLLGECGVTVFATGPVAARYRIGFPQSLNGAPWLLPTENTSLRRALDQWFAATGIRPLIMGEFEDSALKKVFGQEGMGLFVAPEVIADEVCQQYTVEQVGLIPEVREQYYAISVERKVSHPAVVAIAQAARDKLFKSDHLQAND